VRTTDDHFVMEIEVHGDENGLMAMLQESGAVEINKVEK